MRRPGKRVAQTHQTAACALTNKSHPMWRKGTQAITELGTSHEKPLVHDARAKTVLLIAKQTGIE